VATAHENKTKALKSARHSAADEITAFRAAEEAKYKELVAAHEKAAKDNALEKTTERELGMVKADYERNKGVTVDYLYKKVISVDMSVTKGQIAGLQAD